MPPDNAMMAALQQSRSSNPVSSSGAMPGNATPQPNPGNPGADMAKYWALIQEMSGKLDKVLEALSSQYRGKEPDMPQNDGNEAQQEKY